MIYEDENEYDYWLNKCGFIPDRGCSKAGSEDCDFECPFRDDYDLWRRISELKNSESN